MKRGLMRVRVVREGGPRLDRLVLPSAHRGSHPLVRIENHVVLPLGRGHLMPVRDCRLGILGVHDVRWSIVC